MPHLPRQAATRRTRPWIVGATAIVALAVGMSAWAGFKEPTQARDAQGRIRPNVFEISVCDVGDQAYIWHTPTLKKNEEPHEVGVTPTGGANTHASGKAHGTDGSINIAGNSIGNAELGFDFVDKKTGATGHLTIIVHVLDQHRPPCATPRAVRGGGGNGGGGVRALPGAGQQQNALPQVPSGFPAANQDATPQPAAPAPQTGTSIVIPGSPDLPGPTQRRAP